MDVDFLLHIVGFCGIYLIIKNIQENLSRNETKFRRSCADTFQVLVIMSLDWHHVLWLLVNISFDWSSCPLKGHSVCPLISQCILWLIIMSSGHWSTYSLICHSVCHLISHWILWLIIMSSDRLPCLLICHSVLWQVIKSSDQIDRY